VNFFEAASPMRTRVKICGITRREDAEAAIALGADAIGLIFARRSVRRVDADSARGIATGLPPDVTRVGLMMNHDAGEIEALLRAVPLDLLQFHGDEDAAFCRQFGRAYIKAVPMGEVDDVVAFATRYPDASGFVLDSHSAGEAGGTGRAFDWSRAPARLARPLILAGGLVPENVARAIETVRPYAVDVSSGVEFSPGRKDHARMRAFIDEVRRVRGQAIP
jgi:phosphoribosylanthranilate isomerase